MLNMLGKALGAATRGVVEATQFIMKEIQESPTAFSDGVRAGYEGEIITPKKPKEEPKAPTKRTRKLKDS